MLIRFFLALKAAGLPVGVGELIALLDALAAGFGRGSVDELHALGRACLVKDETRYDLYDRVFTQYLDGIGALAPNALIASIPQDWLHAQGVLSLSEDDKRRVEALGGWDALMKTLAERLAEQRGRHAGGSRWIGTGGTSPFGHGGFNPEGVRIGGEGRQGRAVKVWERREYRDLDPTGVLTPRQMALALRQLRRLAHEGEPQVLDLPGTIDDTARNAGWLDLRFARERRNAAKVLLLLDAGGSMDAHVRRCEALFAAARAEFRHLEVFYFHNCVYERVWRENARRFEQTTPTLELIHRYPPDWRLVLVGDAAMSPHEITVAGGSVEHWNEEPGALWMQRLVAHFRKAAWLNPVDEATWHYTPSIAMLRELVGGRMFPLTLKGLEAAVDALRR